MAAGAVITNQGRAIEAKRMAGNTQVVPSFMGFGTGAGSHTAAVGDTALLAQSGDRQTVTITNTQTSVPNDTVNYTATYVAAGTVAIDEIGLFDAATAGNMAASVTILPVTLAAADEYTYTIAIQY